MIKIDIRSDVLKEEVYLLVKQFEKKIPKIWGNVIDRVIDDMMEGGEE